MLNGVEYTVVDSGMLRDMLVLIQIVKDLTTVCTSRITDYEMMQDVFSIRLQPGHQRLGCEQCDKYECNVSSVHLSFNQDLSAWDVSNVTDMNYMFENATSFNQDLSAWDVSNVTNMSRMFSNASSFNQDLSAWDVSNVTSMNICFTMHTTSTKTSALGM